MAIRLEIPLLVLLTLAACSAESGDPTGSNGKPAVLGATCETDADCGGGLTCRDDTVRYRGHKQCARPCKYIQDCGELNAFCLSPGFCAKSCMLDEPCPAGTECVEYPGEKVCLRVDRPRCEGQIASCAEQPTCYDVFGCSRCSGDCSLGDAASCNAAPGCTWSGECRGLQACGSAPTQVACLQTLMCSWSEGCEGFSQCDSTVRSDDECRSTPGCEVLPACSGTPGFECGILDAVTCPKIAGCTFRM